jgi:hypothetical protein
MADGCFAFFGGARCLVSIMRFPVSFDRLLRFTRTSFDSIGLDLVLIALFDTAGTVSARR